MRSFQAVALALSLLAVSGTVEAKGSKPKKPKSTASAKKTTAPADAPPAPVDSLPTPAPAPAPALAPAPAPALAPAPAPLASTSSPQIDSASDDDRAAAVRDAAAKPISVAPLLGIGGSGLGFGIGVRAGYTLPSNVYLGVGFMYHLGTSTSYLSYETSSSAYYPSAEGGYDIRFGRLVVRPYGGLAVMVSTVSLSGGFGGGAASSVSATSGVFYPGCALTYDIPKTSAFIGGDARYLFNFNGGSSFGAFASAGMRF